MSKKNVEHINSALPTVFSNIAKILKDNFDENGQKIVNEATGTAAIIVKLFGQSIIDQYFDKVSNIKLENSGLNTYAKAGYIQAEYSLKEIEDELKKDLAPESIFNFLQHTLELEIEKIQADDVLLIFHPKYHPAIVSIKRHYENVLRDLETPVSAVKDFTKHFNDNIEETVKNAFGDDYDKHVEETKNQRLEEIETEFLWDMVALGHIGFSASEDLQYEETLARWKNVSQFKSADEDEAEEDGLHPIDELVENYFEHNPKNHLDEILFVIADFGKGKSVFLRHWAAQLAKDYFDKKEGLFPIYFNLRNFGRYSSEPKLGVISDYLETDYGIKIDNAHFKKNNYIFLIDSLDESGELTKPAINNVIASIKKIQNIDKEHCRNNHIVITSRPFDEGLDSHLVGHNPYIIPNEDDREIPYYISIHGFTKEQFNRWISNTLETYTKMSAADTSELRREVLENITTQKDTNIHDSLMENKTLSTGELRRPIFAYMIYQLIVNNIDYKSIGKIGVYLSFINFLSKDAKHIHDTEYIIDLRQEFKYRNLLHAIAALWMYKRQQGKQGALKKADICRVLDGENKNETDVQVLDRYKNEDVTEIQFLSHSYFGEKDNVLHFQHQSFAEILLAEYYLKVFVKFALDEGDNVEEARTKLILGEPTEQTIQFLTEMLILLKDTVTETNNDSRLEKRKLLFPLMASLATQKNNKLFCHAIFHGWFTSLKFERNQADYPKEALDNWCIDNNKLDKIIQLARGMIESKTNYILAQAETKTVLYNNELLVTPDKLSSYPPDIDRWLALLVGNTLYNKREPRSFFNWDIENFEHLFDLIRNWNYVFKASAPIWGKPLFKGIHMSGVAPRSQLSNLDLSGIDFSYSELKEIDISGADITQAQFNKLIIKGTIIAHQAKSNNRIIPHMLSNVLASYGAVNGINQVRDLIPIDSRFALTNNQIMIVDIELDQTGKIQGLQYHDFTDPTTPQTFKKQTLQLTKQAIKQGWLKVGDVKRWTK